MLNIRIKNYLSSLWIVSLAYILYTNHPYFNDYFNVEHFIDFFGKTFKFTTFEVFFVIYISYAVVLFLIYFFEKNPSISKSIYFLKSLEKIILSPHKTFIQGLHSKEKVGFLAVLLKLFYAPLMLSWLSGHISSMITNFTYVAENHSLITSDFLGIFQERLYWLLFNTIIFADVFFYTWGYLIEHPRLKNQIKSVDPTLSGWAFAILCYPPFNTILDKFFTWQSSDFPQFDNPYLLVSLNLLILVSMGIYSWASVALGLKASNLTHRGIVSKGPYAYIRHPAYIAKNFAWWIGAIPALISAFQISISEVLIVVFSVAAWSSIYFFRAITEERHLRMVNEEYDLYAKKVRYRFIPGVI